MFACVCVWVVVFRISGCESFRNFVVFFNVLFSDKPQILHELDATGPTINQQTCRNPFRYEALVHR